MKFLLKAAGIISAAILLATCGSFPMDTAVGSFPGNDNGIVFAGYGTVASNGYLYVRAQEDADANGAIRILLPNVQCDRPNCVLWQIVRRDGSYGLAGGSNGVVILRLSDFTERETVSIEDEGEYRMLMRVYFRDPNGNEASAQLRGLVRISVLKANYRQLGCDDPMTAWRLRISDRCEAQYSTRGRVALCGGGC